MNSGESPIVLPATTVVPGKLQTAVDLTVTSATSPLTIYTIPAGHVLYIDYIFAYCYVATPAGAATACQIIMDQGGSLASCSIMRFYQQYDRFALSFAKPLTAMANLSLATLGGAGAGGSFSVFITLVGDVI